MDRLAVRHPYLSWVVCMIYGIAPWGLLFELVVAKTHTCDGRPGQRDTSRCKRPAQFWPVRTTVHRLGCLFSHNLKETFTKVLHFGTETAGPCEKAVDPAEANTNANAHLGDPDLATACSADTQPRAMNLAFDSKLGGCDLVKLHVGDSALGHRTPLQATLVHGKPIGRFRLS